MMLLKVFEKCVLAELFCSIKYDYPDYCYIFSK